MSPGMMDRGGYPISSRMIFGLVLLTVKKGQNMSSTVTKSLVLAALFAICTTAAAASSNQPPRFLSVPALGLRLPLDRLNLDPLPEDIRATCDQIADNEYSTGRMWIFGRAKDENRHEPLGKRDMGIFHDRSHSCREFLAASRAAIRSSADLML